MGDGNFITIGGVRYHKDSVVSHSVTTDKNGVKRYNVTLEGGTQLSYNAQAKSSDGYKIDIFKRDVENLPANTICSQVNLGLDRRPLVLAQKPTNNGSSVWIDIYGLRGATITGNPQVQEDISLENCHNNILNFGGGNKVTDNIIENDTIAVETEGRIFKRSTNNTIFADLDDEIYSSGSTNWSLDEFTPKDKWGNKVKYTKF